MSLNALIFATAGHDPTDVEAFAVLVCLAGSADEDGEGAALAIATIARRTSLDTRTVSNRITGMLDRGVLELGDQSRVLYLRGDRRPTVYNIRIPYDRFASVEETNEWRARLGRPPLTRESRPPIAAPERKVRADKGKRRKLRTPNQDRDEIHGVHGRYPVDSDGVPTTYPVETPEFSGDIGHGVPSKSPRGTYEVPDPLKTKEELTTTPLTPRAAEPAAAGPVDAVPRGGKPPNPDDSNSDPRLDPGEVLDRVMAVARVDPLHRPHPGREDAGCVKAIALRISMGWDPDDLVTVLARPYDTAGSVAAVLHARLRRLGAPPPPPAPVPPRCPKHRDEPPENCRWCAYETARAQALALATARDRAVVEASEIDPSHPQVAATLARRDRKRAREAGVTG